MTGRPSRSSRSAPPPAQRIVESNLSAFFQDVSIAIGQANAGGGVKVTGQNLCMIYSSSASVCPACKEKIGGKIMSAPEPKPVIVDPAETVALGEFTDILEAANNAEDYEQILRLVAEMRYYQIGYFKQRKKEDLIESKRLERRVDELLGERGIKFP
jgi:hypothetical protein